MCLAVPGKIIKIKEGIAIVDYGVEKRKAQIIGGKFKIGDYVIVQGQTVVQKIPAKEAREALEMYKKSLEEQ